MLHVTVSRLPQCCGAKRSAPGVTTSCTMFKRRQGTAGISGHLYETKLLSLLYFRAIHDKRVKEFQLASNVGDIGAFDDICFKATVEGFSKPALVFIQAKHRENKKQTLKIDLNTYFSSYLKIKQRFVPKKKDLLFAGTFDETECLFVIYTPARDDFSNESKVMSSICPILNDLIGTGGMAKQLYDQEKCVVDLCETAIKYEITLLAELIAKFKKDKVNFKHMLNDKNENVMLRYHVILAQEVFEISDIQPNGYRIATIRNDFFDTSETYLTLFRNTLYKEILKKRTIKRTDIENLLSAFIDKPTDAEKLSKLIVTVLTYNNDGLLEINKKYAEYLRPDLNQENVSRSTVNKAVELAAKEILLSPEFKLRVPAAFGNKDITITKKERIEYLTSRMTDLLETFKSSKMITIDESDDGFLRLNGGIAGAIGNIFVLDNNTKLMKITDNGDALRTDARELFENLNKEIGLMNEKRSNDKIPDLCEYKFCFKGNKFPKLLLEFSEHEKNLARDFLNKLLLFSGQADENGVEESLKNDIEVYQRDHSKNFQVETDAIFQKYHCKIQKWWMEPKQVLFLTRESDLFQNSIKNIIKDPLMNSIHVTFMRAKKKINYTFTEDAVRSLNLQDHQSSTVIVAENSVLTIVKVMQHLKNKYYVVLDLEYIANLPTNDRYALRLELATNEVKFLILVCDKIDSTNEMETLKDIAEEITEAVRCRRTNIIIVTNQTSLQIIKTYFPEADAILHDKKLSLFDMSKESQESILETATAVFPSVEIRLELLLKGWPMTGAR